MLDTCRWGRPDLLMQPIYRQVPLRGEELFHGPSLYSTHDPETSGNNEATSDTGLSRDRLPVHHWISSLHDRNPGSTQKTLSSLV